MLYLEQRINDLLSEARQLEIKVVEYYQVRGQLYIEGSFRKAPQSYEIEKGEAVTLQFKKVLTSLYLSTVNYLDANGLNQNIMLLYKIFGDNPEKLKHIENFDLENFYLGDFYSVFLEKMNTFLSSFEFTRSNQSNHMRIAGIFFLQTILRNTQVIIEKNKAKIKSETDVYNAVKSTLEVIFTSSKSPKSNFIKTFKEFKPDILIPELYAAVEYKYASDEAKLKSTIEQIASDVKGYTGDKDYRVFYAVFYVTRDFWGQDKFNKVWEEQDFPKNWIPFYIIGR